MDPYLKPIYFSAADKRLFGVLHPASGPVRAAVLICPPLLHEHVRSYRFFHQFAEQLASKGLACLRFDYHGSGDSEGSDDQLTPQQAALDIVQAADELKRANAGVPLFVLAIRASALFALPIASRLGAEAVWLWQPVLDGAAYLQTLQARDTVERSSRYRYPLLKQAAPANGDDLMGFALSADFSRQLAELNLSGFQISLPVTVMDAPDRVHDLPGSNRIDLPPAVTEWSDEVDLQGLIPIRGAASAIADLCETAGIGVPHG